MNLSWMSWMEEGWQWSLMIRSMGALWNGAGKSTWHCFVLSEFLGTCYENRGLHCCLNWVKNGNGGGKGVVQRQGETHLSSQPRQPSEPQLSTAFPLGNEGLLTQPITPDILLNHGKQLSAACRNYGMVHHISQQRMTSRRRITISVLHWLQALTINGLDRDLGHPDQI